MRPCPIQIAFTVNNFYFIADHNHQISLKKLLEYLHISKSSLTSFIRQKHSKYFLSLKCLLAQGDVIFIKWWSMSYFLTPKLENFLRIWPRLWNIQQISLRGIQICFLLWGNEDDQSCWQVCEEGMCTGRYPERWGVRC